jgi:hypothetical protein
VPAARVLRVLLPLLVVVLVAACAGPSATTAPSASPATVVPAAPVPGTGAPRPAPPTAEPATEAPATPKPPVGDAPSPSLEAEPTDVAPVAAQCTGSDENLAFFEQFASIVDWPVYCPVLPSGWFVGSGQWRQADGARLEISYHGPGGAGLLLQEGAFCPGGGDCVPPGDDLGPADFGDREGTLVSTVDGWAFVVGRGETPSWLLTVTGVGEAAARRIAADLAEVGG